MKRNDIMPLTGLMAAVFLVLDVWFGRLPDDELCKKVLCGTASVVFIGLLLRNLYVRFSVNEMMLFLHYGTIFLVFTVSGLGLLDAFKNDIALFAAKSIVNFYVGTLMLALAYIFIIGYSVGMYIYLCLTK